MNKKLEFLKNFVQTHKVAITIGVCTAAFIALKMHDQKALNTFLKDHGLFDEYYAIED